MGNQPPHILTGGRIGDDANLTHSAYPFSRVSGILSKSTDPINPALRTKASAVLFPRWPSKETGAPIPLPAPLIWFLQVGRALHNKSVFTV
jgi:hypothetical protein